MLVVMSVYAPKGTCSMTQCHDRGVHCPHFMERFGQSQLAAWFDALAVKTVRALRQLGQALPKVTGSSPYRVANYIVYFLMFPLLALGASLLRQDPRWLYLLFAVLLGLVLTQGMLYEDGVRSGLYDYSTEFCIRLGNLTHLSYWGVCILIFLVAMPMVLLWDGVSLLLSLRRGVPWAPWGAVASACTPDSAER